VDPDVEQRALATAHDRRERRREIGIELSALIAQGLPDEQPDLEMSRHAAAEAASIAEELTILNARIQDRATTAHRALTDHDAVTAGTKALRDRYDAARRAHRVCQGRNAHGLSLRRWVLAQELDRVVAVASSHLHAMSAGRYVLRRLAGRRDGRQAAGLDLEVLDSHTGRPRSPSSLSGGEQFQASLALALGLADVVSLGGTASGRRFEALFVDEGFGALDPDALDDAIDTLHQLQAAGRMVGAITHVEAMKERLPVGIEVRRLSDGRGSTLVVNP
jgi:exonuclease SbcC